MTTTTTATKPEAILGLIRSAETSKGYDDFYRGSKIAPPKPVTQMTVNEVMEWQSRSVRAGSKSSAVGGYQMISKTFRKTVKELGLTGNEVFDQDLQDRMGMHLLAGRGYNDWAAGKITDHQFANRLAKEWAGLPVVSGRKAGRSYYAGDGLNASTVKPGDVLQALSASRSGQPYEFVKGPGGATVGQPQTGTGNAPSEYDLKLRDLTPMEGYSEDDIQQAAAMPVSSFRSMADDNAIEQAATEAVPSFADATQMAIDEEWIATNVMRQIGKPEFTPDANFSLTEDLWKEVTDGLDPVYQKGLHDATSEAHLRAIADRLRGEQDTDRQLASMGWQGIGLRFGAAILDPVAIAASVATEGMAAPFIYGAKVGRLGRFMRAGVAAGAVNAGIDGYLATQDQTMGWDDVAVAAAAGFVLGGTFGALKGKTPEDQALVEAIQTAEGDNITRFMGRTSGGLGGSQAGIRPTSPDLSPADAVALDSVGAPTAAAPMKRFDRSYVLKSSESDIMRRLGAGLVEDAVGNADGSTNRFSVSESVAREERVRLGRFYRVYNNAYGDWLKDQGKRMFWQHGAQERSEFNRQVTQAVRRDIDPMVNKHVAAAASQMKKEFADLLQFGKEKGIRGFDEIKPNDNYMVRRHRIERLDKLVEEFGEDQINDLVAASIRSANRKWKVANNAKWIDEMELDVESIKIAKAYVKSIRSRRYGEFNVSRALAGADLDTLKTVLKDNGLSHLEVDNIADKVRLTRDNGEAGRIGSAKWRLDLDETYRQTLRGKDGSTREVSIEDFLQDDAEQLFSQYVRSVSAAGHMEDFLREFRVADKDGFLPAHAPSFETVKGYIEKEAASKGMNAEKLRKEMRVLDNVYKLINGIPVDPDAWGRVGLRMLRDYNFSRIGGQLGVAQLAEVGNVLGQGGLRVLMQNLPALRRIFANARTGKFSDDFLNEIETIWGFGTDLETMNMNALFDDSGAVEAVSRWERADHALQRAKKITVVGSGMGHINMMLQRMNARVLVQRFMDDATGRRGINAKRLRVMGISEEMHPRIQEQLRKHVDQQKGLLGRKVSRINIEKWDDLDARNAFINGVDRWAKKSIQENDIGNMPDFMSKEMWKTIFQFRSFMLAAYIKQTQSGMHHRDWETISSFLATMFFGGLFYVGQTHVNAIGRDDRDEFLEERLSPKALAAAAFQRSGFSSVIPVVVDLGLSPMGIDPIFDYRSSGLKSGGLNPSSAILSNPTGDLLDGTYRGLAGINDAIQGGTFGENDLNAVTKLMVFQNMFIIRNGIAAIGGNLPDY